MKVGTKIRTLYEHSQTGTIVRPRRENLPMPGPGWHVVKFDDDEHGPGGKLIVHQSMLAVANN